MDVRAVVQDYYTELKKGCKTGTLDLSKLHFADDVLMEGPGERFEGKETVEKMMQGFASLIRSFDIKKQYFDADSAYTFINFVSKDGLHSILASELITVKNGKIARMDVVFDTKQWMKFIPR